MSSLDQLLGRPIIPIHQRQQQTDEQQYPIVRRLNHLYKRRMKLWDKKAYEFEMFNLDTKERIFKNLKKVFADPKLLHGWQQQWWQLTNKKQAKKFNWFYGQNK